MTNSAPHRRQESRSDDFPSDPLLNDGDFIDANAQELDNKVSRSSKKRKASNATEPPEDTASVVRNAKWRAVEVVESCLPPGWSVEARVRTGGATAGVTDKYYTHLESGRRFRSRKGMFDFLGIEDESLKRKKGTDKTVVIKDYFACCTVKRRKRTSISKPKSCRCACCLLLAAAACLT